MQLIDLHTHSHYSDGNLSPRELIDLAIASDIGIISITDHDTLLGNKTINFNHPGINIIPGIELSAKIDKGRMHILGYNIDIQNEDLNKKMSELQTISVNSVLSVVEQIKRDFEIVLTHEEIKELFSTECNIGRPNIANILVRRGIVTTSQEAFDRYLNSAYEKIKTFGKGIDCEECIELILKSGGIPVLAHPNTLKLDDMGLLKLIKELICIGLAGIEVYHSSHTALETNHLLSVANKHNLLISGGTDYHGPITKPEVLLGTGIKGNIKIKSLSLIDELKKSSKC